VEGNVTGDVDVTGNLGTLMRRRSANSRRWATTGIWCGGNLAGDLTVGGNVVQMNVGGDQTGAVDITGQLGTRLRKRVGRRTRWVSTGLRCEGDLTGNLTVNDDAVRVHVAGDVTGDVNVTGQLGAWFKNRSGRRTRWTSTGLWAGGNLTGALTVGGDAARIRVAGNVDGAVDVTGQLGAWLRNRTGYRKRWVSTGLRCGGNVTGDVTVGRAAAIVDIDGGLTGATVRANALGWLVVVGQITSVGPEFIRSLLAGSRFYVSDSTWSGIISGAALHVFDGTVTARIG